MQLLLLLLLGPVAAAALSCHKRTRALPTIDALRNADWDSDASQSPSLCTSNGKHVCSHWLLKQGRSWYDFYDGCEDATRLGAHQRTAAVLHYCGGRTNAGCYPAPYVEGANDTIVQTPAYLCCCYDHKCVKPNIYDFAEQQQANNTTPEPHQGAEQDFTCEVSMRNAASAAGLLSAEPQNATQATGKQVSAPCVEFIYEAADGLWHQWRAASPYEYMGVSYKFLVNRFCAASSESDTVDMVEPGSYNGGIYSLTKAYTSCCDGATDWCTPGTAAFVTTGTAPTTSEFDGFFALATQTSTSPPPLATTPTAGGGVWPWVVAIGVLLAIIVTVVIIVGWLCRARRKTEPTEQPRAKDPRALTVSVLPEQQSPPSSTSSSKRDDRPTGGRQTKGDVPPKKGRGKAAADDSGMDKQMSESAASVSTTSSSLGQSSPTT